MAAVVAAAGLAAVLAAAALWVVRQPALRVSAIRIEGDFARNSASAVNAQVIPQLAGNFFAVDLQQARRAFEDQPWVRRAVVRRMFPNQLLVRLEEHQPVALWAGEGAADRLVNVQGEVFRANPGDVEDDDLPTLQGPSGSAPQVLAMFRQLVPVIAAMNTRIDSLALSPRGSWQADLNNGVHLELGRGDAAALGERCARFVRTIGQVTQRYQSRLLWADLRHQSGYAVRLADVSATASPVRAPSRK